MKRKTLYKILAFLVTATMIFASCTKDTADVLLDPAIKTAQSLNITSNTAKVVGFVVAEGDGFNEKGICYNTATMPTIDNNKVAYTGQTKTATFELTLTGLAYATKYFARAYAIGPNGTIYGEESTFTTLPVVPQLTTTVITDITSFTAKGGGNITVEGGATVSARGVCFSTNNNPTVADSKTSDGKGTGSFTSSLSSLKNGTTYYVRAYATNSAGTGYGPEVSFQTVAFPIAIFALGDGTAAGWDNNLAIKLNQTDSPGVYEEILDLTAAKSLKFIQNLGSWQPQWGQATGQALGILGANLGGGSDPDAITTPDSGGKYKVTVNLGDNTYSVEPAYPNALYALGDGTTAGWDNNVAIKLTQTSTPGLYIEVLDLIAAKNLKFIQTLGSWQPQYGQATGQAAGILGANMGGGSDPDAIMTPDTDGKYKVTVDLKNMTYKVESALPSALFMIGDGVGGWGWADVDLPMIAVHSHPNLFWKIVWMEASGGFKFAPQKDWINDFGKTGDATDGIYDKGGDNIPVPGTAGYYMVVVDMATNKISISDPKVYLMGNTIGSWDTSNPAGLFTVDNANSVLSITKTLAADELRMYAWHPWFSDWWQSEFIILNSKIEFRGKGDDQTRVPVTAGSHTVKLNFKTGGGTIQ